MPTLRSTCAAAVFGLLASTVLPPPSTAQDFARRDPHPVRACTTPGFSSLQERRIAEEVRDHVARGGRKNLELYGKYVWVYFHVIHDGEEGLLPEEDVHQQIKVLNEQFGEHPPLTPPYSYDTQYRFKLGGITYTDDASWFTGFDSLPFNCSIQNLEACCATMCAAEPAAALAAKAALRHGGAATLNIYSVKLPGTCSGQLLGYARFPTCADNCLSVDGIVIDYRSVPDADSPSGHQNASNCSFWPHLSRGMTAVHEVGHWMGLYHTFQGGCSTPNDYVMDDAYGTPAESFSNGDGHYTANYSCPVGLDTCPNVGPPDQVSNVMTYTWDQCRMGFWPRQVDRMNDQFSTYRLP